MKFKKRAAVLLLCAALLAGAAAGCAPEGEGPSTPTMLTIWHYYKGAQQQALDDLIQEFNETEGNKAGIVVEGRSCGKIEELNQRVLDAAQEKVGADEIPDMFASYADTAYEINRMGKVANLSHYITQEELSQYIPSYWEEGRFQEGGGMQLFPVAKATELFMINETAWDAFSQATGASDAAFATWEGIAATAQAYYDWTDGQTPDVADDGKVFFGRDAFANYMIIGSLQLGTELFHVEDGAVTLQIDRSVMRRLWDNFYVPFVQGYYGAYGNFRSDDLRTGDLVALVGSTSSASFFPKEVTLADGTTVPIEGAVYPLPNFAETDPMAVQQGAGMVVTRSNEKQERAAVAFLKWFTAPAQNVRFAVASGYMPVTRAANDKQLMRQAAEASAQDKGNAVLQRVLEVGVDMTQDYTFYTSQAFSAGSDARRVVNQSMVDWAKEDRAAVEALMAGGTPRAEAVATFLTDAHFEQWLAEFTAALHSAVDGK